MKIEYVIGNKTFYLDKNKAEEVASNKKVINGRKSNFFDILPLKYQWAYDLYKTMKSNHWEPEDIPMNKDILQWRSKEINDFERWVIKMGIGYFSAAEGIVGDNILHVVREVVTAPELKLVLGRHAHEENIHADSLVYMISSLGLDPYECEAIFLDIDSVRKKNDFVNSFSYPLRNDVDLTITENKKKLAKNIFVFGLVMEGTQFYSLFGMILALYRQGKFPGIGQMFRYTLRDESNHIELFRKLLLELVNENPDVWDDDFKSELREVMGYAVDLEHRFIEDALPHNILGLKQGDYKEYIRYIADRRLISVGLDPLFGNATNTLPWLTEVIDVRKEQNFFEGRVTEYRKASALVNVSDDEL
ncbi:MAG: ribonucleotide-diphosphate reductase subunit beta [Candidatus Aenigmatarchaeota archaeon]